jgi:uncharacterized alkaline shock family protein YloU
MEPVEAEYDISLSEDLGQVSINNDVVARVAAIAAMQLPGVSLGGKFNIGEFLSRKEPVRGVGVEINQAQAIITLDIKVEYGQNMYDLAHRLQRRVKDAVEQMTGLRVSRVNVAIVDILAEPERRERGERREEK